VDGAEGVLCSLNHVAKLGWYLGGRVDWEGIIVEDVLDGSNLCVVVVVLQVVFSLLYRNLTVACWCWVGWLEVWNDGIRECRCPVYGNFPVFARPMDGDIKEVYLVVCLRILP